MESGVHVRSDKQEQVELGEIIEAVVNGMRPVAQCRYIRISRCGLSSVAVLGNRARLIEAVGNLLHRAIRHCDSHTTLDCDLIERGRNAVVRVLDPGCLQRANRGAVFELHVPRV
jgi:signal transduction histidine kinase